MAHGKHHTCDRVGEESPPSSPLSGEVTSRVDANGVLTRLKPVGDPNADAFWRKYSFPPQVRVSFPSSGPQFTACTDMDRG